MTLRIFIAISFFASLFLNIYFYRNLREQDRVADVVDGDTFQLSSGKRVRLMGVDAPELSRCGGKEAYHRLDNLISGKIVTLSEAVREAYGPSLALVYSEGKLINKIILEEGWARTDYRKNTRREVLTAAFHGAQNKKRGIFGPLCIRSGGSASPAGGPPFSECAIKGNIDKASGVKIYHLPDCRYYDDTILELDRGEQFFCSEEEAQTAGFDKASSCP